MTETRVYRLKADHAIGMLVYATDDGRLLRVEWEVDNEHDVQSVFNTGRRLS